MKVFPPKALRIGVKVTCRKCGNVYDWNNEWPAATNKCPSCGAKN